MSRFDSRVGGDGSLPTRARAWSTAVASPLQEVSDGACSPSAVLSPEQREQAKAERRNVIESNKAWNTAESMRRD